ncbi:hypothetical protein JW935_21270 [candidate division KSB1 bacterium]|nr:hypothetical protein [candidate division KSB1 bacterium]
MMYVYIFRIQESWNLATYRISIALICFILSSVSAMLFSTKANLKGTIGFMTFTVAGPAILWVIVLLIFNQIFPDNEIIVQNNQLVAKELIKRTGAW